MRYFFSTLILLLFTTSLFAQGRPSDLRKSKVNLARYKEDFYVDVIRRNLGVEFKKHDPILDDALQQEIDCFFDTTNESKYRFNGSFRLHIVQKDEKYYVQEGEGFSERLLPLCDN